jgi:hypothetical protein
MRAQFSQLLFVLLFAQSLVCCQEIVNRGAPPTALASFPISTDVDRLVVPVKIETKTYRFLIETGTGYMSDSGSFAPTSSLGFYRPENRRLQAKD